MENEHFLGSSWIYKDRRIKDKPVTHPYLVQEVTIPMENGKLGRIGRYWPVDRVFELALVMMIARFKVTSRLK